MTDQPGSQPLFTNDIITCEKAQAENNIGLGNIMAEENKQPTTDWHKKVYSNNENKMSPIKERQWRGLKRKAWHRAEGLCERCSKLTFLNKGGATAHHIIAREKGGTDALDNLIWLCADCHNFVEDNADNLVNRKLIIASYKTPIQEKETIDTNNPDWHTWVYGGAKNPNL